MFSNPSARMRPAAMAALLAAGTMLGPVTARAGSCPPDQVLTTPSQLENIPSVGVSSQILHEVDLTGWRGLGHFVLRTRRLFVAVDGTVPLHTHEDRPSIVTIVSGEIIEHSNHCAVPIIHRAADSTPEFGPDAAHWWENKSGAVVELLSSDIVGIDMVNDPHM